MKYTRCEQLDVAIKSCVNLTVRSLLTMVSLALPEDTGNGRVLRRHVFKDHADLSVQGDDWLMSPFRLPRAIILEFWAELGPALERKTLRKSRPANAKSSPHHTRILCYWIFKAR